MLIDLGGETASIAGLTVRPVELHIVDHDVTALLGVSDDPAADLAGT
jgi:hypothetical protein